MRLLRALVGESEMTTKRGFGIAGTVDLSIVRELSVHAETSEFRAFWSNDTPNGDGLTAISEVSKVTSNIEVGVGVVAVDHRDGPTIAVLVEKLGFPKTRAIIGVGSGGIKSGALDAVRAAVVHLKKSADVRVYIGALGPKMCQLGGEIADGILLGWVTPEACEIAVKLVAEAATKAGRPRPKVAAYVRTALHAGAVRIKVEGERYASYPAYAANFARMNATHDQTTAFGTPDQIQSRLAEFERHADEVIVRAIVPNETLDEYVELMSAATP
jgi:alkanesulfonate monooxygenase SsuD/methylene tetrahydromethanopterin reductase-like flavin-dependent oxidoreductase (luciferase family)